MGDPLPSSREEPWTWAGAALALVAALSQLALFASLVTLFGPGSDPHEDLSTAVASATPPTSIACGLAALVARAVSARTLWKTRRYPHPLLTAVILLLGGGSLLGGVVEIAIVKFIQSLGHVSGPF